MHRSFTYEGESLGQYYSYSAFSKLCVLSLLILIISQFYHDILLSKNINIFLLQRIVGVEALSSKAILVLVGITLLKTI